MKGFLTKKIIGMVSVCFLLFFSSFFPVSTLTAQSSSNIEIEWMKASTVLIVAGTGSGSGFVVGGGRYIVTNWHVADNTGEIFIIVERTKVKATVKVKSEAKDLAILELQQKIDRPEVIFAPASQVRSAQQVYAMGFPGAAMGDNIDPASAISEVKISDGIIAAMNVKSTNGTPLYQITAAINPGNSGGPLFNLCGHMVGINVMKALAEVITTQGKAVRVPEGEGIGWAVKADELFPLLDQAGISYRKAGDPCLPGGRGTAGGHDLLMIFGLAAALILAVVAVFMASTNKGRQVMRSTFGNIAPRKSPPEPVPFRKVEVRAKPILRGITGQYGGAEIVLNDDPLAIGRDPNISQLVLSDGEDCDQISGRHCVLTYDFEKKQFLLEDNWSTNGTFLQSGKEVKSNEPVQLQKGDRFYLSTKNIMFEVTEEE